MSDNRHPVIQAVSPAYQPLEDAHAERLLELLQLRTEHRLADVAPVGGATGMTRFGDDVAQPGEGDRRQIHGGRLQRRIRRLAGD
jgi:hypothetical protein